MRTRAILLLLLATGLVGIGTFWGQQWDFFGIPQLVLRPSGYETQVQQTASFTMPETKLPETAWIYDMPSPSLAQITAEIGLLFPNTLIAFDDSGTIQTEDCTYWWSVDAVGNWEIYTELSDLTTMQIPTQAEALEIAGQLAKKLFPNQPLATPQISKTTTASNGQEQLLFWSIDYPAYVNTHKVYYTDIFSVSIGSASKIVQIAKSIDTPRPVKKVTCKQNAQVRAELEAGAFQYRGPMYKALHWEALTFQTPPQLEYVQQNNLLYPVYVFTDTTQQNQLFLPAY